MINLINKEKEKESQTEELCCERSPSWDWEIFTP